LCLRPQLRENNNPYNICGEREYIGIGNVFWGFRRRHG
jgi:hypothetical protein